MIDAEPFCRLCTAAGTVTRHSRSTRLDHIRPLVEGGTNQPTNLQPLCRDCHDLKTAQESARARGVAEPTSLATRPTFGPDGWPIP